MTIPFIIAATALLIGESGVGLSAKDKWDSVKNIVLDTQKEYDRECKKLKAQGEKAKDCLERLGELKICVFENQITHIVEILSKNGASSKLGSAQNGITAEDIDLLKEQIKEVKAFRELSKELLQGDVTDALTGFAAYGVSALGVPSVGVEIAGLSGITTNDIALAWLGGREDAIIGKGGVVVTRPSLLIATIGYTNGKADEALTEAENYTIKLENAIGNIKAVRSAMKTLRKNAKEATDALQKLVERFEQVKVYSVDNPDTLQAMLIIGKRLKEALSVPLADIRKVIEVKY